MKNYNEAVKLISAEMVDDYFDGATGYWNTKAIKTISMIYEIDYTKVVSDATEEFREQIKASITT